MKFSPEKPKFAKGVIEFDEITCCALTHGFAKNKETVEQLKKIVSPDKLKKTADILPTTKNMALIPTEDEKIAYSQIAKKEQERLESGEPQNFHCRHTLAQHLTALKSIIKKIQPRLN